MTENPFTNRELKQMFKALEDKLDQHAKVHSDIIAMMDKGFTRVTTRQDVANGRTKTNELRIAYATGGLAVISMIALPILAWALFALVNMQSTISDVVASELESYEFDTIK